MASTIKTICEKLNHLSYLPPLFFRLVLAYGFYGPATHKLKNFGATVEWFQNDLNLPLPLLNAVLATATENIGIVLLTLGLATRFISIPMMFTMVMAIATVHYPNGFECSNNGFEVPLYYLLMLFSLVITGAGKISVDHLIARRAVSSAAT